MEIKQPNGTPDIYSDSIIGSEKNKEWDGKNRRKKRISGRKIFVFIITCINLNAIYFTTLFKDSSILTVIGVTIIIAHLINGVILIGGNTLDKITMLKFFNNNKD